MTEFLMLVPDSPSHFLVVATNYPRYPAIHLGPAFDPLPIPPLFPLAALGYIEFMHYAHRPHQLPLEEFAPFKLAPAPIRAQLSRPVIEDQLLVLAAFSLTQFHPETAAVRYVSHHLEPHEAALVSRLGLETEVEYPVKEHLRLVYDRVGLQQWPRNIEINRN